MKPAVKPDEIIPLPVCECENCKKDLSLEAPVDVVKRQVIDIPDIKTMTTEYQADVVDCPDCHTINTAKFPEEASQSVQYGNNLKSIIVYMKSQNLIPYKRLREFFEDIFSVSISEGTFVNVENKCSELLKPFENKVKKALTDSEKIHCDESGVRIENDTKWVHVASNEQFTHYFAHEKRGREAMDFIGILPNFKGTAIHDFWRSYLDYDCSHGLCNAHHIRELTYFHEELNQKWAEKMIRFLCKLKDEVDEAKIRGQLITKGRMRNREREYDEIIRQGILENPLPEEIKVRKRGRKKKGKVINLLERFLNHKEKVLAFMYHLHVPFDNNAAERDIRMVKVQQKVSGCFRSMNGANSFFRIRSFISTVKKNGQNTIESIRKIFYNQDDFNWLAE